MYSSVSTVCIFPTLDITTELLGFLSQVVRLVSSPVVDTRMCLLFWGCLQVFSIRKDVGHEYGSKSGTGKSLKSL